MPENETVVFDEDETRAFREASSRYDNACAEVSAAERLAAEKAREFRQLVGAMETALTIEKWDPYKSGLISGVILAMRDCHQKLADALGEQAMAIVELNGVLCKLREKVLSHAEG